jgi:hypothetical protein
MSTAVSWTLFELADIQLQLRAELRPFPLPAVAGNAPLDADTLAKLDHLPLLNAVVRASLRVHALAQNAGRVATEDTAIPLARPFVDRCGALQHEIRFRKGLFAFNCAQRRSVHCATLPKPLWLINSVGMLWCLP